MSHDNELREILDTIDMDDWLDSNGIEYRKTRGSSGMQLNVKECPVCGNSKWKVYLGASTGLGNCFAGDHPPGKNFNKWVFIRAATPDVSTSALIDGLKAFGESRGWRPKRVVSEEVSNKADWTLPENYPIPIAGKNLKYLTNRGIGADLARYFKLSYCLKGFFRYRSEGNWRFMDFSRRILIPVYDLDGNLVTFQGRDITGTAEKKYLFPPGLLGSGRFLYNGFNVQNTTRVVVGEGAFDVIAMKKAFDDEPDLRDVVPVGTFGKHLSYGPGDTQQGEFLKLRDRGVQSVTLMWDGEVQATDDAITAGIKLQELGFSVRIAMLPKDKDPNEVPPSVVIRAYYDAVPLTRVGAVSIMMQRRKMNDYTGSVSA